MSLEAGAHAGSLRLDTGAGGARRATAGRGAAEGEARPDAGLEVLEAAASADTVCGQLAGGAWRNCAFGATRGDVLDEVAALRRGAVLCQRVAEGRRRAQSRSLGGPDADQRPETGRAGRTLVARRAEAPTARVRRRPSIRLHRAVEPRSAVVAVVRHAALVLGVCAGGDRHATTRGGATTLEIGALQSARAVLGHDVTRPGPAPELRGAASIPGGHPHALLTGPAVLSMEIAFLDAHRRPTSARVRPARIRCPSVLGGTADSDVARSDEQQSQRHENPHALHRGLHRGGPAGSPACPCAPKVVSVPCPGKPSCRHRSARMPPDVLAQTCACPPESGRHVLQTSLRTTSCRTPRRARKGG